MSVTRTDHVKGAVPNASPVGDTSVLPGLTTRMDLGARLGALRKHRGMTMAEVAEATGLSRTFIGLVEKGKSEIAVSRLLRLVEFYGVTLSDVIGEADPAVDVVPLKLARDVPTGVEGVTLRLLAPGSVRIQQPFMVSLDPGTRLDGLAHRGDEFVTCTAGRILVEVAEASHNLGPGDTIFYAGRLTHSYVNEGDEVATLVGSVAVTGA